MVDYIRYKTFEQLSFADSLVYSKLPSHPFWSHIESKIDFSFADRLCAVLYTGRGQHPFAPSLKLKVHLVQAYYDLPDRQVEEKIIGDLFIKRFLHLPVDFFGFDHSTIGLDRNRMGTSMFHACHLYILAQMCSLGLWGDRDEQWIIDSFPCHVHAVAPGSYRLIQQGMIRLVQHLKRGFHAAYKSATATVELDSMMNRPARDADPSVRLLAFSKLVAQAHALLLWFETDKAISLMCADEQKSSSRQRSLELQNILKRILEQYTRRASSSEEPGPSDDFPSDQEEQPPSVEDSTVRYEKIPPSSRSTDRIVSASHPDVRIGKKNTSTSIRGFKIQNLCTTNGVLLDTRVISAIEHDRDAMVEMVTGIQAFFRVTPSAVLGDTAYGHGKQRERLEGCGISVVAPVPTTQNPTSLYDISRFTYHADKDVFTCPNGKETIRKQYSPQSSGTQYKFGKKNCDGCPFREECTTNKSGRTVFRSDYHNIYEQAKKFNETDEGKEAHKRRYWVERKNQELKNDCGLGDPRVTRQKSLGMKTSIATIVVNLKLVVRKLFAPKPGFIRRVNQA